MGSLVATLGLFVPSSILCYGVARVWGRYRGRRWHTAVEKGLSPIGTGLLLAGVISIFRIAETGVVAVVLALASAATVHFFKNIHPLVILRRRRSDFCDCGPLGLFPFRWHWLPS